MNNWNTMVMAAAVLSVLSGCTHSGGPEVAASRSAALTDAEEVRDIVLGLPHWLTTAVGYDTTFQSFDGADMDAYELAAIKLQGYASADVRTGIGLAISESNSAVREAAYADAFVLLRVLFDVPATISMTALQIPSPYAVYAYDWSGTEYPLLWPVSVDTDNVVSAIADFLASQGGAHHDVLGEYDWFELKYGHRALPSCVGRCGSYNANEACQCDMYCDQYGDCCVDYTYTCGSTTSGSFTAAGAERPALQ